jgi:phosphatidyl-myo-inositol alpha-mannosyltransferase
VKVGIVVPFSWSYIGGVGEHAESQAEALEALGVETRLIMGYDPPLGLARRLHSGLVRKEAPPARLISLGSSVVVPANGSRPNIVLSPASVPRLRRALRRERFDVLHLHEPMTPAVCVAALALARVPLVATWHATGELNWMKSGLPLWGSLIERVDHRIAVSDLARTSAARYLPGEYEIIPNGIAMPAKANPDGRRQTVVYVGRHERRKGLNVLLRAWPEIQRRTGARLRVIGANPRAVLLTMARERVAEDGIDLLGTVVGDPLSAELAAAKLLVAPSLGGESFGMVLARAFGCATPVVASDIPGYARVMAPHSGVLVPPGRAEELADAVVELLEDEPRRQKLGAAAREHAIANYSWAALAPRLAAIYRRLVSDPAQPARRSI